MQRFRFYKKFDKNTVPEPLEDVKCPLPDDPAEFLDMIKNIRYELVLARQEGAKQFTEQVMKFSTVFEYDFEIETKEHEVEAKLIIEALSLSGYCKQEYCKLLMLADDVLLLKNPEDKIVLILTYYTHEAYMDGKKMRRIT